MHCDKCNKRKSTVIYHENINGRARTLHLCADCANTMEQAGELEEMSAAFAAFSSPLLGITDQNSCPPLVLSLAPNDRSCPACGSSVREIAADGRVGCAACYENLGDIWGDPRDRGTYRGRVARLVRVREENACRMKLLRTQLADALNTEQYEQAAILRDRIRELEAGKEVAVASAENMQKEGN